MTLWLLVLGCRSPAPTIPLALGEATLHVEVADEPAERRRGLAGRRSLADDHGMLFVFSEPTVQAMWAKDTPLALSVAWVGPGGDVVGLADLDPGSHDRVTSGAPVQYAIEASRGWFAAHGIVPGVPVRGLPAPARY